MTKLEICSIEDSNPGVVYLYPEATFHKAYQQSAWLRHFAAAPNSVNLNFLASAFVVLDSTDVWIKSLTDRVLAIAEAEALSAPLQL